MGDYNKIRTQKIFMTSTTSKIVVVIAGVVLRILVFTHLTWNAVDYVSHKIDFSTPLSNYARLVEGVFRLNNGLDPYSDDYVHVNPILISLLRNLISDRVQMFVLAVALDSVSTIVMMNISHAFSFLAGVTFFFNPFTIMSPVSLTIQGFNVLTAVCLLLAVDRKKSASLCALLIAVHAILNPISSFCLVLPLSVAISHPIRDVALRTFIWYALLHCLSYFATGGSLSYFYATVVSPLMVSNDTLPNFGLTWNIFTVMFEKHMDLFRLFFGTFQILVFVPTYIRFSSIAYTEETKQRYFVLMMCAILLFQPYPTALDFSLVIALVLATDETLFHNMLSRFLPLVMFAVMVLSSVMSVVYVERNQGSPSFLFNINAISVIAGALSIANGLKVARLDGYVPKEKKKD